MHSASPRHKRVGSFRKIEKVVTHHEKEENVSALFEMIVREVAKERENAKMTARDGSTTKRDGATQRQTRL